MKKGSKKVGDLVRRNEGGNGGFPILKGHPAAQKHAEEAVESQQKIERKVKKEFKIYRWSPHHPHQKPFLQSFFLDLSTCGPMVIHSLSSFQYSFLLLQQTKNTRFKYS